MEIDSKTNTFALPTDALAVSQGCYFDERLPNKIIKFCKLYCVLTSDDFSGKGGKKFKPLDWQETLIRTLYGWKTKTGGLRFNRVWCYLPRRQGKSVLVSALATYTALTQQRAEIYILASSIEEAQNCFKRVKDFVASSPELSNRFWIRNDKNLIEQRMSDKKQGSIIKIMSSEKHGKSGTGSSLIIMDEFCSWPSHSARIVYDRLYDSIADRPNGIQIAVSTPQFDFTHIGRERYLDAKRILDGKSEDIATLPVIYEAPDTWEDDLEGALKIACPSLNKSVALSYYLNQYKAIKDSPLELVRFQTMCLGRWVGSPTIWIPPNVLQSCIDNTLESSLYGCQAIIGLDFGSKIDLTSYSILIEKDGLIYVLPRFFMPRENLQKRVEQDSVPYDRWLLDPKINLTATPGDVVDGATLLERLKHDASCFNLQALYFDPYGCEQLRQQIEALLGIPTYEVNPFSKTMSPLFSKLEELIRTQKIRLPDNPLLRWNFQCCIPKRDKNDRLMVEKASTIQRIDGVDSIAIGLAHYVNAQNIGPPPGQSYAMLW